MAWVVFLRAVNVGGHQTFRPSLLAKDLAHLDVQNVGAAGSFIVWKHAPLASVRAEFARCLPFKTDAMICSGKQLQDLVASAPLPKVMPPEARGLVTVLASLAICVQVLGIGKW